MRVPVAAESLLKTGSSCLLLCQIGALLLPGSVEGQEPRPRTGATGVVSRTSASVEVFWVRQDGSVWQASWSQGALWRPLQFAPAGTAAPTIQPTVVSRVRGSLEVFWIGPEGSIEEASRHEAATGHAYGWRVQAAPRSAAG